MADFIRAAVTFVLSNFPLTFFVIGLGASLIAIAARSPAPLDGATLVEKLISWHISCALGRAAAFRSFAPRLAAILDRPCFFSALRRDMSTRC